jgi:hypothetical protein
MFADARAEVEHWRTLGHWSNVVVHNGEVWVWQRNEDAGYHWGGRYPIPPEGVPWCGY